MPLIPEIELQLSLLTAAQASKLRFYARELIAETFNTLGTGDEAQERDAALMLYGEKNPTPDDFTHPAPYWQLAAATIFADTWRAMMHTRPPHELVKMAVYIVETGGQVGDLELDIKRRFTEAERELYMQKAGKAFQRAGWIVNWQRRRAATAAGKAESPE